MAIFNKKFKKEQVTSDGVMDKLGINPEQIRNSKAYKKLEELKKPISIEWGLNPVSTHYKRSEWLNFLTQLDMRQWCSTLEWINIPNGLTSWLINHMLYYRGSLIGFKVAGKFFILPYAINKGINIYGLPNSVIPITYNGASAGNNPSLNKKNKAFNLDLIINNYGDLNKNATACILYSNIPFWSSGSPISPFIVNSSIISQMADILCRVNIQIINSNKKLLLKILDGKQAPSILAQLKELFNSSSAFGVVSGINIETIEIQPDTEPASDLWMHFTSFNNLKHTSNGIDNTGTFEKKERENATESKGDKQAVITSLSDRLMLAKLFINQLKLLFPDDEEIAKFDVRINPQLEKDNQPIKEDLDVNN